ncbi:MAG: NADH:ubiquinone oxidoreductase [Silicimonas sp.]
MSRHTQGSLTIVGAIAAGIFLVAFVALMVLGEYAFSAAAFLSILIALVAAVVLYLGFGGSDRPAVSPAASKPAPAPKAEAAPEPAREPAPAPEPEPAPVAAATPSEDFDGDGVAEGTGEGTRPEGLDAPRGGEADDLKQIKGVGPKLEKLCNSLGFWHFDQIASWTPEEVAWVDANLQGFKGRVSRDNWIEQARILASGGETEFSKRVEDGDVY